MSKYIYLLVGASGSGKTTVTRIMEEKYGWKSLDSYTTRKPRYIGEKGHIFVDKETFDLLPDKVGYTVFDNNEYCATALQVDESDIYIIDPAGVDYFTQKYRGKKKPVVISLNITDGDAIYNMAKRGDDYESTLKRNLHDKEAFANMERRLQFSGIEHMSCHSDEVNTPEVIAQIIYENRQWREMEDGED